MGRKVNSLAVKLVATAKAWFGSPPVGGRPQTAVLGHRCPLFSPMPDPAKLSESEAKRLFDHLLGHILDDRAGDLRHLGGREVVRTIMQDGIEEEIRVLFNDQNNPLLVAARGRGEDPDPLLDERLQGYGPEEWGVAGVMAEAELMAEAFRIYLVSPDYMKEMAPKVAKRIRVTCNSRPWFKENIQFS